MKSCGETWALVLAGGDGTRLQELTRQITGRPIPKQYCRIDGDRSLLEATLDRIAPLAPAERTLAVISRHHLGLAAEQLRDLPPGNVLVQKHNRDTGPGVLLPLLEIARRDPAARVAVFPSDHYVGNRAAFVAHVRRSLGLIADLPDKIALLGVRPDRPEPGYGYIEPGAPLRVDGGDRVFEVARFREKPDRELARTLMAQGGLWNSFVLVAVAARIVQLVRGLRPGDVAHLEAARRGAAGDPRPWNFSSDFLSRIAEHLLVVEAHDLSWSDWGTRESIERTFAALERTPPWDRGAFGAVAGRRSGRRPAAAVAGHEGFAET